MTIYEKSSGKVYSLGATGAAPRTLKAEDLSPDELSRGIKAGVVPGLFGGWVAALDRSASGKRFRDGVRGVGHEGLEPMTDLAQACNHLIEKDCQLRVLFALL